MIRKILCVLFVSFALLVTQRGDAGAQTGLFFDEFGAGPRATAMGQAFTAVADNYSAAYYNPAGLTQIPHIFENATGYLYASPEVKATFPGNSGMNLSGQPSSRGMLTGIASSLDIEQTVRVFPWFRRFAFGLVTWMNLPEINQYHAGPVASRPHFLRHDMRFQLMSLVVATGVEVTPWLSVGCGVIPSLDTVADQDNFAAVNKRDDEVMGVRLSIHQEAHLFLVPVLGVLIRPREGAFLQKFAIGFGYRGENKGHHGKGPLRQVIGEENEAGDPISGIFYPITYTINLVSFAPEQYSVGIAMRPTRGLTLAYDMTWKRYARYRTFLEAKPDPPFSDTLTYRFGVEQAWPVRSSRPVLRAVNRVCLRAGYYFEPTPVDDGIGPDNIYDSDQNVFSAGLCVSLPGATMVHDLELLYQYHRFRNESRQALIDGVYAYQQGIDVRDAFVPVAFGGDVWSLGACYTIRF